MLTYFEDKFSAEHTRVKKQAEANSTKKGHRVLVFGQKVFDGCHDDLREHENAEITTLKFPGDYNRLKRLSNFTLVIVDYAAFLDSGSVHGEAQGVFEKMMVEALASGTCFCFVYFNESVPRFDRYGYSTAYMNKDDMERLAKAQIGYRWLYFLKIKPLYSDSVILFGDVKRQEFQKFFERWGGGHHQFEPYGDRKFDEVLIASGDDALGFVLNARRGKLLYLPYQRDFQRVEDFADGMYCLIDSILSYLAKSSVSLPMWAAGAYFPAEKEAQERCDDLEKRIQEERERLAPFKEAKALLFQSEYSLESAVPEFFKEHLKLAIDRNEQYQEDFWILDENGQRTVMVEVKSAVKGFKKSQIYAAFNHREGNKLAEDFPVLLVTNCNLQGGSWKEKTRPIDKQDYELAAQNNILIVRVEDCLHLWAKKEAGAITSGELLNLFTSKTGWLEVTTDGVITERKLG
jgi:hypothetical protein